MKLQSAKSARLDYGTDGPLYLFGLTAASAALGAAAVIAALRGLGRRVLE